MHRKRGNVSKTLPLKSRAAKLVWFIFCIMEERKCIHFKLIYMPANDVKKQLLDFINKKAFDPILRTKPEKFSDKDREAFEELRRKTENEKKNFEEYGSAD